MTTFLVHKKQGYDEAEPGLTIPGKIQEMGYKGVDTTELVFTGYRTSPGQILGGTPGRGCYQMMDGAEFGRVNVAARGCGVALRAFELAVGYAQQRTSFGKPIAQLMLLSSQCARKPGRSAVRADHSAPTSCSNPGLANSTRSQKSGPPGSCARS
jgi:alkylation response protein AidB-like acyl-CoA dehydrogenase